MNMQIIIKMQKLLSSITLLVFLLLVGINPQVQGQSTGTLDSKPSRLSGTFSTSFVTPFTVEKDFQRIGSFLSFKGGPSVKIDKDKSIGVEFGFSLGFLNGSNTVEPSFSLPQARFEYRHSEKLKAQVSVGCLYDNALGLELNTSYLLKSTSPRNYKLSTYVKGIVQNFQPEENELLDKIPNSWLTLGGLQFVQPITAKWNATIQGGIGARGGSDFATKFLGNGKVVLSWDYLSVFGIYTNALPGRGFPSRFLYGVNLNVTALLKKAKGQNKGF